MQQYRKSGFSLIELSVVLSIIGIIVGIGVSQYTAFNDQTTAVKLASQARTDAAAFISFIKNNYASYYTSTQNGAIVTIAYSTLINNGYAPLGANSITLNVGQSPCAAVIYNPQSKSLQAIMYYTAANTQNSYSSSIAFKAAKNIGAAGGYITANFVHGTGGSWQLPLSSNLFSGISSCDFSSLPNNGLVVNLSMLSDYPQALSQDYSLHRIADSSDNAPGTANNTNTMQTDIIMADSESAQNMHGIFFASIASATVSPYLTTGNNPLLQGLAATGNATDVVLANAGFAANSINTLASGAVAAFSTCTAAEQGKIAQPSNPNGIIYSQLQCSYNPFSCNNSNGYCYVPIIGSSTIYHPNTTTFTCTNSYIDTSITPVLTSGSTPPSVSGCTWGNPINTWSATNSIYSGSYSVPTTITASTEWTALNCTSPPANVITTGLITSVACTNTISAVNYAP